MKTCQILVTKACTGCPQHGCRVSPVQFPRNLILLGAWITSLWNSRVPPADWVVSGEEMVRGCWRWQSWAIFRFQFTADITLLQKDNVSLLPRYLQPEARLMIIAKIILPLHHNAPTNVFPFYTLQTDQNLCMKWWLVTFILVFFFFTVKYTSQDNLQYI